MQVGGLYSFNLEGGPVDSVKERDQFLLRNQTSCTLKNSLVFTDSGDCQVKAYNPVDKVVTIQVGEWSKRK